ncbi:T6SS effector amidase Tae4 family protein [Flavobacterium anhuiense]|uniref:T6SS effector amidase Tae4 family protein n=1 Tax=Flavobacterium anhuiense TaxID=459526 RepID=UPI000E6C66C3|nr:T6SS effector amidase Tae4 family protein [Flavobacterium anhuiense]
MNKFYLLLFFFIANICFSQSFHDTQGKLEITNSGQANYTIPIAMPPSIKNVGPVVNLVYASGQMGGIAGQGWSINSISNISRISTRRDIDGYVDGVDFDENDKLAIDGQRLILKSGIYWNDGSVYETEVQSNIKVELKGSGSSIYFIVTAPDGSRSWYGNFDGVGGYDSSAFYIVRFEDVNGNYIKYSYSNPFNKTLCIDEIKFSGNTGGAALLNSIKFNYKPAKRNESAYIKGSKIEKAAILDFIEVRTGGQLFRKYQLTHISDPQLSYEYVSKIQEFNGALESANPIEFEYKTTQSNNANSETTISYSNNLVFNDIDFSGDFDGDGHLDFVTSNEVYTKMFQGSAGTAPVSITSLRGTEGFFGATTISSGKLNQFQSLVTKNLRYSAQLKFDVYNLVNNTPVFSYGKTLASFNDNLIYNTLPYEVHNAQYVTETEAVSWGLYSNPDRYTVTNGPLSNSNTSLYKEFLEGDFDGNGISEVLVLQPTIEYQTRITNYYLQSNTTVPIAKLTDTFIKPSGAIHAYMVNLDPSAGTAQGSSGFVKLDTSSNILYGETRLVADFNSDGKSDLLVITAGKEYKVITFKQLTSAPWVQMEVIGEGILDLYSKTKTLLIGDYNGDGKSDLMIPDTEGGSGQMGWSIYYSNPNPSGGQFFVKEQHNIVEYWPDTKDTYDHKQFNKYYALDTNGDGKTDLVKVWEKIYRPNPVTDAQNYDTQWIVSTFANNIGNTSITGNKFTAEYTSPCYGSAPLQICNHNNDSPDLPYPIVSKYKYMGANTELLMVRNHHNQLTYVNFTKDVSQDILMTKVTSSVGAVSDAISYAAIDPGDSNNGFGNLNEFYSSSQSVSYPNVEIKKMPNSYLVSMVANTSEGTTKYQDFRYNGLLVNLDGLGPLGFIKMARSAWYLNGSAKRVWNVIENEPGLRNAIKRTYTELLNAGNAFSFVNSGNPSGIINSSVNSYISSASGGVYTLLLDNKVTSDYITGVSTKVSYQYDSIYKLPLVTKTENFSGSTLQGTITTTENFTHNPSGIGADYFIGRPSDLKVLHSAYGDTFETFEKYTHTGNKISKLEKKGNTANNVYVTEDYEYDIYGNLLKKTLSYPGALPLTPSRIVETTYDATGRFIKTTKDIEGFVSTNNSYHPLYGLVTSRTNPQGAQTLTVFDNWGKISKETDYLGKNISYAYSKASGEYSITQTGDDGMQSLTVSDALGRIKKTGKKNIDDTWSYKNTEYDFLGRKIRESEPYNSGSPSLWNTTSYDDYNRTLSTVTAVGKITNITYNGLTVTASDGTKTTSSTKNANGDVVSASDNGGQINYNYYANGNVKDSEYLNTKVSVKYNEWGIKSELTDPSAGTYLYTYYPSGEIWEETTPNGKTTYTYNSSGKILSKTIYGVNTDTQTSYNYDPLTKLLASSTFTDNIEGKTISYSYEYDSPYRRLTKTIEATPYARFEKEILSFDDFGRVSTEKFTVISGGKTSSKTITKRYKNGYSWALFDGNTRLWMNNTVNARGQVTNESLGNNINVNNSYDQYGYITEKKSVLGSSNVVLLTTLFDAPTGNLRSRSSNLFYQLEEYGYDNLDRLTTQYINEEFINSTFSTNSTEGFEPLNGANVNASAGQLSIQATAAGSGLKKNVISSLAAGDQLILNFKVQRVLAADNLNVYVQEIDPATGTGIKYLKSVVSTSRDVYVQHTVVLGGSTLLLTIEKQNTTSLNVFLVDNFTAFKKITVSQAYDNRGRITSNQTGTYNYTNSSKLYQNTSIIVSSDALSYYQGRQTQSITYNSFKSPYEITEAGIDKISFTYNDNNDRSSMFYGGINAVKTQRPNRKDYSFDGSMEVKTASGSVELITYIGGDAYTAPLMLKSDGTTENYFYLHRDYQGSIVAITNSSGSIVEKRLFDSWGLILKIQDGSGNALSQLAITDRGYTGHEHLQSAGLIHMNGRLYDPIIRRFLQPDNNIQEPYNTQNFNRYGYCLNNPLKYTDVSGELWGMGELLSAVVIGAIISASTYGVMAVTGHVDFTVGGLVKATFMGALSGAVTFGIGSATLNISNFYLRAGAQALLHADFQGMMAGVQNGNAVSGMVSGALSSIASSAWTGGGADSAYHGMGKFAESKGGMILFGTISGGAGAELSGGNFWQGAATGLYVSALNHGMSHFQKQNVDMDKLIASYPGDETSQISSTQAFDIGGTVKDHYDQYVKEHPGEAPNACALRVSIAFNKAGYHIRYSKGNTFTDKDGLNYYLSSEKMAENLPKQFNLTLSKTTKNSSLSAFNKIKGIYFMQPISPKVFGALGHISLWNGSAVLGGHSYADSPQFYQATLYYVKSNKP